MVLALLVGLACGFVGSIPVAGPASVLVVERSLGGHARAAFGLGVGTAVAETGYAILAFLGTTAALTEFRWFMPVSRVLGAAILVGLGLWFALGKRPPHQTEQGPLQRRARDGFWLGLAVTAVNPTLVATWTAVATILHSTGLLRVEVLDAFPFGLGVGCGVTAWFAVLIELLRMLRKRMTDKTLDTIVRVIGWILVVAGAALLIRLAITGLAS
jgi:threonine/homoserine/homoserine lactone efflux protein